MNKYCRVCLDGEGNTRIFSEKIAEKTVATLIMICTSVKISVNDGLPSLICQDCMKNLNVAYHFKKQCEESDVKLRRILSQKDGDDFCFREYDGLKDEQRNESSVNRLEVCKLESNVSKSGSDCNNENIWMEGAGFSEDNESVGAVCSSGSENNINVMRKLDSNIKKPLTPLADGKKILRKIKKRRVKLKTCRKKSAVSCDKDRKIFVCEICSKSYNSRKQMRRHQITHGDKKQYSCSVCEKEFHYKGNLQVHERIHTGERPFLCNTCGKSFIQVAGLQRHLTIHNDEKPFLCNICNKRFKLADSLTCHLRTHTMERPYQCQKCGKSFSHHSGLNKHIRVHTGEKNYQCKQCGKSFGRSDSLAEHVKIHTGERPHRCSTCGSAFSSKSTLKVHIRTHTSEKPYKCNLCEKSFTQSSVLSRHIRTHTGERPYSCATCGLSFSLKVRLVEHTHSVHPNNNQNVNDCLNTPVITNSSDAHNCTNYSQDVVQNQVPQNYSSNCVLLANNNVSNTNCSSNFGSNCNSNNVINMSSNSGNMNILSQNEHLRYFDSMKMNPYYSTTILHHQL